MNYLSRYSFDARGLLLTLAWLFLAISTSLVLYATSFSIFFSVGFFLLLLGIHFSLSRPLTFLAAILILRMSLDYSSQFVSIQVQQNLFLTLSQIIGVGMALIGGIFLFAYWPKIRSIPLKFPIVLFLTFCAATAFYSVHPGETLRELLRILDFSVIFAIAYATVTTLGQYKKLLIAMLASSLLPIALGIYQFFQGIGFTDEAVEIPRIYGTFSHPNVFSLYLFMVIGVLTLFHLLWTKNVSQKLASLIAMSGYFVVVLATYTRIAWISLFTFFLVLAGFRYKKLLAPLLILPVVLYLLLPPVQERIDRTLDPSPTDSIIWRQVLWQDAIAQTISQERWLWGYGLNTFPLVSENLRGQQFGSNEAHNDLVKFFVEGGVIGLAVYIFYSLGILGALFSRFVSSSSPQGAAVFLVLFALALSMMVASASDNVFRNTPLQWIFWALLGASFSVFGPNEKRV